MNLAQSPTLNDPQPPRNAIADRLRQDGRQSETPTDIGALKLRILLRTRTANVASQASRRTLVEVGTLRNVPKGHSLLRQDDEAVAIAMIGSGRVRLIRSLGGGRSLPVDDRGPGDLVGEASLGGATAYRESALATENVEALMVPVVTVRALVAADPAFGSSILSLLVERNVAAEERVASLLYRNVEGRLAEFLLKAAARWGIPNPRGVLLGIAVTHQEIASAIGSTRETVTMTLGVLRKLGIIAFDRRRIVIVDRQELRARA